MKRRILTCLILLAFPTPAFAQGYWVHPLPGRWCEGDVTYSFTGSGWNIFNPGALDMQLTVYNAADVINNATLDGSMIPIRLRHVSSGGQISIEYARTSKPDAPGETVHHAPGFWWLESVTITFDSGQIGSGCCNNGVVALHELLHALGLHHAYGAGASASVMYPTLNASQTFSIDAASVYTLECIYGNLMTNVCTQRASNYVMWKKKGDSHITILQAYCLGCRESCPQGSVAGAGAGPEAAAGAGDSYELAVSDNGGPYEVIATLTDTDWVEGEYDWAPTTAMTAARLRMRIYDAMLGLKDETEAYEELDIEPVVTAVPAHDVPFEFTVHPNPGRSGWVSLLLPTDGPVQLAVYDFLGRRVALLEDSWLSAGAYGYGWNGRNEVGQPVASGVYIFRLVTRDVRETRRMVLQR